MTRTAQEPQNVPVQLHQSNGLLVLTAPMPGMEPEDISVRIHGDQVAIRGDYRGSRQDQPEVLVSEWTIGPYYREFTLPQPVHGALTNVTYGNGVLVLSMPTHEPGQPGDAAEYTELRLEAVKHARGQHVGHTGAEKKRTTTEAHRQQKAQRTHQAGGC
jgi:HSP20 family protein